MSNSAERAQTPTNSAVRNTTGKGSKQATDGNPEKVHQKKLKGVQTRLSYSESSGQKAPTKEKTQFSESESDKGPSTDECIHLRKQIEKAVKSGQLSHLIKELKQGSNKGDHAKAAKKGETSNKEKAATIFMVQPWQ
ncbi:hypothetical protein Tco_0742360 [Tanacetum coccineum]